MLVTLDRSSGTPVFRQICDQVRFQVAAGMLPAGMEIPSTRDLAAQLAINPMTVSKAYGLLEQEGVLERRPGLPLVVRGVHKGAPDTDDQTAQREELFRALRPAVIAARQLGLSDRQAISVFRDALEQERKT